MTYNEFLIQQALVTARGEKARFRRQSRKSSARQQDRAIQRKKRFPETQE